MVRKTKRGICPGDLKKLLNLKKENLKKTSLGTQIVADFWNCQNSNLNSVFYLKEILFRAAKKSNNTPLKFVYHKFKPQGLTAVLLLAESHIAVHSWPEFDYWAIDIFTCGKNNNVEKAFEFLKKEFFPQRVRFKIFKRSL
ncbi:MAG: adenosylmethionine decarboxylase [Minisyncoccales bacterium]